MRTFISQLQAFEMPKNSFICTDKETCVPGRAIPIGEMWSKFLRGENIVDPRMMRELSYQTIEGNPYFKKGVDLADKFEISQSIKESHDFASKMLEEELSLKNEDKSSSQEVTE